MNTEQQANYTVALDNETQSLFEAKNLEDRFTDVFLVPLLTANEFVLSLLDTSAEVTIRSSQNQIESAKNYPGVKFTVPEHPQIVIEEYAYPCSLAMAIDDIGHFAVVHTPHFAYVLKNEAKADLDRYYALQSFISDNMRIKNCRMILSGTNIVNPTRDEVFDSIQSVIAIPGIKVEHFVVESQKPDPNSEYISTTDAITGVVYIPRQFTQDGKQKLVFLGVSDEDFEKTQSVSLSESLNARFVGN